MATKFSQFTAGATTANTLIVGFDSNLNTNNKYTLSQLAAGISPHISIDTIYTNDGTLSGNRTISAGSNLLTIDVDPISSQWVSLLALEGNLSYYVRDRQQGGIQYLYIGRDSTQTTGASRQGIEWQGGNGGGAFTTYTNNANASTGIRLKPNNSQTNIVGIYSGRNGAGYLNGWGLTDFTADVKCIEISTERNVGIGMNSSNSTPTDITARLHVKGSGLTNTTHALKVQNSDGTDMFSLRDDGVAKYTGQVYTELHDTTNATLTVNWNDGNIQELTSLTGSLTFTPSNPKAGATYILTLAQTGTVTATWTGVKWPADTPPTLSGAGKTDVITLICYDEAANSGAGAYYGASTLNFTT